ncbi:MAG: hypothetical protein ACRESW_08520 [Nevskiales bacterium]
MSTAAAVVKPVVSKRPFYAGVFLITFSVLIFQIVQTRILSVIAWYYLAFFAISVAMLGMTAGAVWLYLRQAYFRPEVFATRLSDFALASAVSMLASLLIQFSLIVSVVPTFSTVFAWGLLLTVMAVPYVFSGVVVSLALTRSPFKVSKVYSVDMIGAALGCVAVVFMLDIVDGPSSIMLAAVFTGLSAYCFFVSASDNEKKILQQRPVWLRPIPVTSALAILAFANSLIPVGIKPIVVKVCVELSFLTR